tara:strand:+ start:396 stop:563 length:168 start_codon:yes stop_codon:yes gene_type:complete
MPRGNTPEQRLAHAAAQARYESDKKLTHTRVPVWVPNDQLTSFKAGIKEYVAKLK